MPSTTTLYFRCFQLHGGVGAVLSIATEPYQWCLGFVLGLNSEPECGMGWCPNSLMSFWFSLQAIVVAIISQALSCHAVEGVINNKVCWGNSQQTMAINQINMGEAHGWVGWRKPGKVQHILGHECIVKLQKRSYWSIYQPLWFSCKQIWIFPGFSPTT